MNLEEKNSKNYNNINTRKIKKCNQLDAEYLKLTAVAPIVFLFVRNLILMHGKVDKCILILMKI